MDIERNPASPIMDQFINPRCRVWNDDDKEYVEFWNDREVRIPAKGYIEMDLSEARNFIGTATPMFKILPNKKKVQNLKKLRHEIISEEEVERQRVKVDANLKHRCMICGDTFKNNTGLSAHVRIKHADKEAADTPEKFKEIMEKEGMNDPGTNRNVL